MKIPRVHFDGALFHIFSRSVGGQTLFHSDRDFMAFKEKLGKLKELFGFKLHAWALMTNHFHLLMQVFEHPTWEIMHRLKLSTARRFMLINNWEGHVFERRYGAVLCEKQPYLLELGRYIPNNPVRAGLVDHPEKWRWSSFNDYFSEDPGITDTQLVLDSLNCAPERQLAVFRKFVEDGMKMGHRKDLYPRRTRPFLGSRDFVASFT